MWQLKQREYTTTQDFHATSHLKCDLCVFMILFLINMHELSLYKDLSKAIQGISSMPLRREPKTILVTINAQCDWNVRGGGHVPETWTL